MLKRSPRTPIPTIFATANIPKPQLTFPDAVDNSLTRPRSNPPPAFKHHAMVPSGFEVPLDYEVTEVETLYLGSASWRNDREVALRRHPYFYETRHLPYPTSMLTSSPPIVARPIEETEVEVVDTPEQLERMVEVLKQAKEIAVDLEHHDTRSYYGFTCLIQISTRERDWLVDPLALRGELREGKLGGVLADPSVVKVRKGSRPEEADNTQIFHGSDSDIVWLQKDFDMFVVNLFDTYHATKVLGE